MNKIYTVRGEQFVNQKGEPVRLKGINFACFDPKKNHTYGILPEKEWETFASYGCNVVRLGVWWSHLEPEPGQINETYIDEIERIVESFAEHGIATFLDMHQDLYAKKFNDGAPDWATFTDGAEHKRCPLWYISYYMDEAVQNAIQAFWDNRPAEDGVGLMDHFSSCWKALAKRFKNNPWMIGYDMYNEPEQGKEAREIGRRLIQAFAEWISRLENRPVSWQEAFEIFYDENRFAPYLVRITPNVLKEIEESVIALNDRFDIEVLTPFYEKVGTSIRQEDETGLLMLCNGNFTNMGTPSSVQPLKIHGKRDPYQCFSYHGYDLVCDTNIQHLYSQERAEYIMLNHIGMARRYGMPLLIGEWGAFRDNDPAAATKTEAMSSFLAKRGISYTFWVWKPDKGPLPLR